MPLGLEEERGIWLRGPQFELAQATTQSNLLQVPQHLRRAFASDAVQGEPGLWDALQEFIEGIPKF